MTKTIQHDNRPTLSRYCFLEHSFRASRCVDFSTIKLAKNSLNGNMLLTYRPVYCFSTNHKLHMPNTEPTSPLPLPELNSVKDKLAIAYMHGLNATVNYSFQESGRDFDKLGIDIEIKKFPVGQNRTVSSDLNEINIQLKGVSSSSTTMITETDSSITYNLKRDLRQVGTMYLIVVVLPPITEFETWREINEDSLLMKARAYYKRVNGVMNHGHIDIPKTNRLTHDSYKNLFDETTEDLL